MRSSALTGQKTVWVVMKKQANLAAAKDIKDWKARGAFVVNQLQGDAALSQAGVQALLTAKGVKFEAHWIVNALKVTADQDTITALASHPDVQSIEADRAYAVPVPEKGTPEPKINAIEWGLTNIRAPEVWSSFGARGQGIVVANIDTGVEYTHPALVNKYRGRNADGTYNHNYNWFDPANVCGSPSTAPCDNAAHGSHTMGTMVGDDGNPGANQIGVAPGAKWIAAKGCESNSCSLSSLTASGEWLLAPKDLTGANPRPEMRPHIINNSWGGGANDPFYQQIVRAWVAAGIFPAFSNGNAGPACGSAGSPGDYPESYAAGAYDVGNRIASFSSRGPGMGGMVKPNIAAPGVNVRSSVPGGGYDLFSGTSMASPHVAGAVALLWSSAPSLVGDIAATKTLLNQGAVDTNDTSCGGTAANNNVFGEGRLDIYAAVNAAPRGPTGTLAGTVTGPGGPIAGANISATGPTTRATQSSGTGAYSLLLPTGTYSVTVTAFGFAPQTVTGVVITQDNTTTRNFTLVASPSFSVSGVVRDGAGRAMAGARVTIEGTPIPPAQAGADGRYSFASVPAGTYQVSASGGRCFDSQRQALNLTGNATLDFQLPQRSDSFGYFCQEQAISYIEAGTATPITGDDAAGAVTLPFPFPFYGQTYTTAQVATNGFLTFLAASTAFSNGPIPSPALPNASIYPFWDDLVIDGSASIRTATTGTAPNRKFVIEWRNAALFSGATKRVDFEVVLGENGHILMQYRNVGDDPDEKGASATVGIEDQAGAVALQYASGEAAVANNSAVLYRLPPSGFIEGRVTDANDGQGISGAQVRALRGDQQVRTAQTARDGSYRIQIPVGSYRVEASYQNYGTAASNATVAEDAHVTKNFALKTARAELNPPTLQIVTTAGKTRNRTITLRNTGTLGLEYRIGESGGRPASTGATLDKPRSPTKDPLARDSRGLYDGAVQPTGWGTDAPGNVIRSFTPTGLSLAWGVGVQSNVWLSDVPTAKTNTEFTMQGAATGRSWNAPWATNWNGDMAYDSRSGTMCQVNVGGDNGIYCWRLADGSVAGSITGTFPWTAQSQRGLAYRPDDDSFYIGGWNEGVLYHVKGLSHADKGAVIGSCNPADKAISGLAYNPASQTIWVATNSQTDTIYQLNPNDCTVLSTLPHPAPGFHGGGLEMEESGNLWTISQSPNMVYLIDSGVPAFNDVPWLTINPARGTVRAGGSQDLTVTIDTTGMQPGIYLANLFVSTNSGRSATTRIPVSLIVSPYIKGVDVGNDANYSDMNGDVWVRDKEWRAGDWGYVRDAGVLDTSESISGTSEDRLYRTERIDPYAYRFDNLPNGIYQVDLRFAEIDGYRPGERLFDVIIQNQLVLPALDISFNVGEYAADDHVFYVPVTTGRLDVRFVGRPGYGDPIVNGLRVTHRPDRN